MTSAVHYHHVLAVCGLYLGKLARVVAVRQVAHGAARKARKAQVNEARACSDERQQASGSPSARQDGARRHSPVVRVKVTTRPLTVVTDGNGSLEPTCGA